MAVVWTESPALWVSLYFVLRVHQSELLVRRCLWWGAVTGKYDHGSWAGVRGGVGQSCNVGVFTNQEVNETVTNLTPYEKLEIYKEELEKINQYNQQLLSNLEKQIRESDDANLEQLKKEIEVLKRVIDDNKKELEQVIQKLSEIELEDWTK